MDRDEADRDPEITCFPRDDAFTSDVQAAITRSRASVASSRRLLDAVRQDLASRYPGVVIRRRNPLASLGDDRERWYVYRDGRIA